MSSSNYTADQLHEEFGCSAIHFNGHSYNCFLHYFSIQLLNKVTIFQSPEYISHNSKNTDFYHIELWAAPFKIKWFQGWATMLFAYNCQITLFYVRGELMHKTETRTRKISRILIGILISFYLLICLSGYFSLGENGIPKVISPTLSPQCSIASEVQQARPAGA